MKIVHLTSSHVRYDARVFERMCKSISNKGYETKLIVADGLGDCISSNVQIIDIGKVNGRLQRFILNPIKIFFKVRKFRKVIFHLHDTELLLIANFLKFNKNKVIFDMHEVQPDSILTKNWLGNMFFRSFISRIFSLIEYFALRGIDCLIVVQPLIQERYKNHNKNVKVILNYAKLKENISINKKNYKNIIYIGAISEERGLSNMLNLINHLPNEYHLHLAGLLDKEAEIKLQNSFFSKITYHGQLEKDDLFKLLEKCAIGLIMFNNIGQYNYSYSLKLFEYMQFGFPVIMPDFGEWIQFNQIYNAGYNFDPKNFEEIAKIIINIDDITFEEFNNKNPKLVKDYFNWDNEFCKLVNIYNEI